jgi:diguanylate cyclase (GGDEF)-like protein
MHIDLTTLYLLVIGTLLAAAVMTVWERKARPEHAGALDAWAAGYVMLALGCLAATRRAMMPGICGAAFSNLVILSGYLLILNGVAGLAGRRHIRASLALLMGMAGLWVLAGTGWRDIVWIYASALPIAMVCGATAREMLLNHRLAGLRAWRVVIVVTGAHGLLYVARALVLPELMAAYGQPVVAMASAVTMYGGVLYSMLLPMALLALLREEAHERVVRQSLTDYLTGLGNRQCFFEQGTRMIEDQGRCFSLLAFDMDHFKTINDSHGHATGDEVLKAFAHVARDVMGPDALLARIGGEEFAALLPDCRAGRARIIGLAVVRGFAEAAVSGPDGAAVRATVSIGLSEMSAATGAQGRDLAALLSAADRALYAAKALGRNRVELAMPEPLALAPAG